jgi:hypothetical protein
MIFWHLVWDLIVIGWSALGYLIAFLIVVGFVAAVIEDICRPFYKNRD